MDIRQTIVDHSAFRQILQELKDQGQKASLLYDSNGLDRAEGMISALDLKADTVVLNNGPAISIPSIVAVNGTFLSDYSEC